MAENEEVNIITHLLELEKESSKLIDDAVKEAQNRTSQAKSELNASFKKEYDTVVAGLEKEYQDKLQNLKASHSEIIDEYKNQLTENPKNKKAFNKLMDELLA